MDKGINRGASHATAREFPQLEGDTEPPTAQPGGGDRGAVASLYRGNGPPRHGPPRTPRCSPDVVRAPPDRRWSTSVTVRDVVPRLALSPDEAAESLGVSRDYLDEHVAPELRWVRRGRRKFVAVAELERWLAESAALTLGDR
jgi:hypothetical protein